MHFPTRIHVLSIILPPPLPTLDNKQFPQIDVLQTLDNLAIGITEEGENADNGRQKNESGDAVEISYCLKSTFLGYSQRLYPLRIVHVGGTDVGNPI
jgi:hypothetical protein